MQSKVKFIAISIITVILLYFLWRKYRLRKCLENFDASFAPQETLYDESKMDEEGLISVVYLEFIYKENPECSITRQFLSGCCKPIISSDYTGDDIDMGNKKILAGQKFYKDITPRNTEDYTVDSKPTDPTVSYTYDETTFTKNKVYKGMDYKEGNTCNPVTYYADEICNLSKESTLYYLKQVITEINKKYNEEIYNKNETNEFTYKNAYLVNEIPYKTLKEEGILGVKDELKKLFHFHLAIKLSTDPTGAEDSYPVIKLQIPKLKENDKIDYDTVVYKQNVNNIDQVMEFIYMNVVINVDNTKNTKNTKQILTLFDTYYNLGKDEKIDMTENKTPYDIQKYSLYNEKRIFNFVSQNMILTDTATTSNNTLRPNFIKEMYFKYKQENNYSPCPSGETTPCPSRETYDLYDDKNTRPFNLKPKLYFIHETPKFRDIELYGQMEQEDNYLVTRPNMYWEDVGSTTNDTEFKDYTHIVILLEDINLKEYYKGLDKDSQNLVYWFAWNISKLELLILKKKMPDLLKDTESFSQLYPYQLIKKKDNAFFIEDEMSNSQSPFPTPSKLISIDNNFKRHLNIRARIVPITFEENNKFNTIYQNYLNRKHLDITLFYRKFFEILNNNDKKQCNYEKISVPFLLDTQQLKDGFTKFHKNTNIRDKDLTLFNYGGIRYQIKTEQVIHLPYEDYYEILVIDTHTIDNFLEDQVPSPSPSPALSSSIKEKYGRNEYHEYLKTLDFTSLKSYITLTVDGSDFSPIAGDFTYRIPYKTKTIQVSSTNEVNILIRLNPYPTQRFIWNRFINDKDIKKQGLLLNTNTNNIKININLSRQSNFMVYFKADREDGSVGADGSDELNVQDQDNDIILLKNNDNKFFTFLNISESPQNETSFILKNSDKYNLYDGTITFLPDKFKIDEYRLQQYLEMESYDAARVKTSVIPYKMRCAKNRNKLPPHQILPTLEWKTDLRKNELPNKELFYAIEASYLKSDGSEKPLYLAWDILPSDTQHQYQIFPSNRKNRKDNLNSQNFKFNQHNLIQNYGSEKLKSPSVSSDLKDVYLGRKFVSIKGRDCEVIGDIKLMSNNITKFKVTIPEITEITSNDINRYLENLENPEEKLSEEKITELNQARENKDSIQREKTKFNDNFYVVKTGGNSRSFNIRGLEFIKNNNNEFRYENENENENKEKYIFLYNKNLGIWQIFLEENGVEIWIANQARPQNLLDSTTDWLFSPDFHYENYAGKYDFFDFPNQFNRDIKIRPHVIDFTRKVKLSIISNTESPSSTESPSNTESFIKDYQYDCNPDKSNIKLRSRYPEVPSPSPAESLSVCDDLKGGKFNYRYFNTTLFNIPSISETDNKGNLINFDSNKLNVDEEGDMFMEVPVRIKIYPYIPNTSGPTSMEMSHAIRKQYLDSSVINTIKVVLREKIDNLVDECSSNAYKYFIEEIQDEILSQGGDLDKVFFQEIFDNIMNPPGGEKMRLNLSKYNSLNDIPNRVRTKKVIHDTKELSSQIIKLFEDYTKERLLTKNFYSYGNYELKQNETIVSYQVPVKPECLKIYQGNHFADGSDDKVLYSIQKSIFYKNSRLIQEHIDIIKSLNKNDNNNNNNKIFSKENYEIKIEYKKKFSKEVLKLYSNEVSNYISEIKSLEELFEQSIFKKDEIIYKLKALLSQDFTVYNLLSQDDLTPTETGFYNTFSAGTDFTRDSNKSPTCNDSLDDVDNYSNFLKRHIQVVSIVYFYEVLRDNLFVENENENKNINIFFTNEPLPAPQVAAPAPQVEAPAPPPQFSPNDMIPSPSNSNFNNGGSNEGLFKDINRKIEQYNNYVGEIYKEVCEAKLIPQTKPNPTPTETSQSDTDIQEPDIYSYYKDMIFSIFDKQQL